MPELLGFGTCDGWQYFLVRARARRGRRWVGRGFRRPVAAPASAAAAQQQCHSRRDPACLSWALRSQATSLEGPALSSEEGWALGEEVTCAAAFAALDAVRDTRREQGQWRLAAPRQAQRRQAACFYVLPPPQMLPRAPHLTEAKLHAWHAGAPVRSPARRHRTAELRPGCAAGGRRWRQAGLAQRQPGGQLWAAGAAAAARPAPGLR